MIFGYIILGLALVVIGYQTAKEAVTYHFRKQNANLSDAELKRVAQKLYDVLDDYGWEWRTALQYRTALKMLQERKILANKKGPA